MILDEATLWEELDAMLREAPTEAADIAAELAELQARHIDSRRTERPGEAADWSR